MKNYKLTDEQIKEICRLYVEENIKSPELSIMFNVSISTISNYFKRNGVKIKKRLEINPGDKFDRWTVIMEVNKKKWGDRTFLCECSCVNKTKKIVPLGDLRKGRSKSCGCLSKEMNLKRCLNSGKDYTGQTFGRLTVLYEVERAKNGNRQMMCKCSCDGNIGKYRLTCLVYGQSQSCGCYAIEKLKERSTKQLKDYQEKYPLLCEIEEMRDCLNGSGIEVRCKKCREWFKPTITQLHSRISAIERPESGTIGTENNFYCSDKCKHSCDTYRAQNTPKSLRIYNEKIRCNQPINRKALLDLQIDECGYNYCEKCGTEFDKSDLALHHNIMVSKDHDMADDMSHQILCCIECHEHKGC